MDLLHHESPKERAPRASELKRLSESLTFGFARGIEEADLMGLVEPILSPSRARRDCFESDLFLDELLDGCFSVVAEGRRYDFSRAFLRRVLVCPASEQRDAGFRQEIFAELIASPELRAGLERGYVALRAFRQALCASERLSGASAQLRRRIEILIALRRAISVLSAAFPGASSGLRRVSAQMDALQRSREFERLEQLLSFEDARTVLETRLQLGYDGTLRRFEIVQSAEQAHEGFSRGGGARFWRRLLALLKGFRFSEEDVMSQLLDQVFSELEADVAGLLRLSTEFEFYLAGLGFRDFCERAGLSTCLPEFAEGGRELSRLFNPWLLAQGKKTIPCSFEAKTTSGVVILTGPNSGGKTRFLQAISLAQLLGQVGLFVPAERARLVWVDQLFLSLREHAEADQKEGRLGMELLRIRKVFETSGERSLIVMDELCSGTNPSEGEEIFEMVLELLRELRPQVFISTHFLDFASRLASYAAEEDLRFLQVELGERDVPTYQFIPGVAKTSLAQTTASRLGVTRDELFRLVQAHKESEPS